MKKALQISIAMAVLSVIVASVIGSVAVYAQELPREETLKFSRGRTTIRWNEWAGSGPSPLTLVFMTLFIDGESYGVRGFLPLLAERYEWVDPYTVRVYIRPEAKWSDGVPITADDVIFTIETGLKVGRGPGSTCRPEVVSEVRAVGDKVVEFVMNRTSYEAGTAGYIQFVDCWVTLRVYPKHALQDKDITELKSATFEDLAMNGPISGPYKVISIDKGAYTIYYERDDNWWGKDVFGLPRPKYLIQWMSGDQARVNALLAGDLDWDGNGGMTDIYNYFDHGIYTWDMKNPPYYRPRGANYITINMESPKVGGLNDVGRAIRLAMVYAFPWDDQIEYALSGAGIKGNMAWLPEFDPFLNKYINKTQCKIYWGSEDCKISTDLEKAGQILDQAGVVDRDGDGVRERPDNGEELEITYLVRSDAAIRYAVAELFKTNLEQIGFRVEVKYLSMSTIEDLISKKQFDIADTSSTLQYNWASPWSTYFELLASINIPQDNYAWYNNPEMDNYIAMLNSPFEDVRLRAASKIQEILFRDIPYITYHSTGDWYQYRTDRWWGWPTAENPWWWPAAPFRDQNIPILWGLASRVKGEPPQVPWWVKPVDKGGLLIPLEKFWDDIESILVPPEETTTPPEETTTTSPPEETTPGVVTKTVTKTETSTVRETVTIPSPTTVRETVTDWTVTAAVGIVLLVVGIAIGYIIKRR